MYLNYILKYLTSCLYLQKQLTTNDNNCDLCFSLIIACCKGLEAYLLRSPNPLPVDVKSAVCELAQNRAQIFGVPEGTLYAHEISFVKSCTIYLLEVTKV